MLTISQAAERLGLSRKTLWLQINRGSLHGQQIGKMWVVTAGEVERYRRENKGQSGRRPKQADA
ncbi:MAG: helix-turn-helix domain-containing protein [Thermomicrobia bacterium]|nr:helix-turn-helix domain-containing protein [Thermomicrobia bacterium]MCA1722656.1 helix-turn-helix domain-containing protein [Thermomicrobia bacterium]